MDITLNAKPPRTSNGVNTPTLLGAQVIGLEAQPISVEVDVSPGLRMFSIVGLADKSVAEARERIFAALKNIGARPPQRKHARIIVNLAPADIKKEGTHFDLPIALGYLIASGQASFHFPQTLFLGELGLKGDLKELKGTLAYAMMAKERGMQRIVLPEQNIAEAQRVGGLEVIGAGNLSEVLDYLEGRKDYRSPLSLPLEESRKDNEVDLGDIRGQEHLKRALEVAAAGGHNMLMVGSPGAGKTLLAKALASILPPLSDHEALEVSTIHSIAGTLKESEVLLRKRPFRNPHHTASPPAILGGGSLPKPGEVTLAHRGVLFLDEFPEFDRRIIEGLREPMEEKVVRISRVHGALSFPASFMLVAAMNPCPCGRRFDPRSDCVCRPGDILKYERKVSQPILDRIDMVLEVAPVELDAMAKRTGAIQTSQSVAVRVQKARVMQGTRLKPEGILTNAEMSGKLLERIVPLGDNETSFLKDAGMGLGLSARGWHKVIKVARTIADLDESVPIHVKHLAEALQYRPKRNE